MNIKHARLKAHSLTGRINLQSMLKAFKAVKRNRGAAGIDKVSIEMYEKNLGENLSSLMRELKKGTYKPIPIRRVYIPKGNNKTRPLGIPPVKCRVGQEAIRNLINSLFDSRFHPNSFGFRPGRNCHQAVERVIDYARQGYKYVVDADIKGFFDNIPHHLILESVAAKISDGNILSLIEKFLKAGVMEDGELKPTHRGTTQGGVISPLLANIVLDHLDWHLEALGHKFVRYADDFVILCKTRNQAERALEDAKALIEDMELQLSPEKTHIRHYNDGFDFLGFTISSRRASMRQKSEEKLKTTIRSITKRSNNLDQQVCDKLNQVIRGTVNYFYTRFSTVKTQFNRIDQWIRRRIRLMKYKRTWATDNRRLKNKHIERMGILSCKKLGEAKLLC